LSGFQLALIHSRLAVIDLEERARQPFVSSDSRWKLLFNGEIYNYVELRKELESLGCDFVTTSDTEVLLWAWRVWGFSALSKLRGMFAFVAIDLYSKTLWAVRDPFGIKPLFYEANSNAVSFASEISALARASTSKPLPNSSVIREYLMFGAYDRGQDSFFEGIRSVAPGSIVEVNFGAGRVDLSVSHWFERPDMALRSSSPMESTVVQVRDALFESVSLQLRSDVPVAVSLSGGLDSSSIAAIYRKLAPKAEIPTFSFVMPGKPGDESQWSTEVSRELNTNHHEVKFSRERFEHDFDDVVLTQGEPFGSLSVYAQYLVYREIHDQGLKVVLDGQGGDEVFAGYAGYPEAVLRSLVADKKMASLVQYLISLMKSDGINSGHVFAKYLHEYGPPQLRRAITEVQTRISGATAMTISSLNLTQGGEADQNFLGSYLNAGVIENRFLIQKLSNSVFSGTLMSLLRHGDRNSMRFSVESRVPFLDLPLITLLHSLPERAFFSNQAVTKPLLRDAMAGFLPDKYRMRPDKVGFVANDFEWLRLMMPSPESILDPLFMIPWIRVDAARSHLLAVWEMREAYSPLTWRLICLSRWICLHFDRH